MILTKEEKITKIESEPTATKILFLGFKRPSKPVLSKPVGIPTIKDQDASPIFSNQLKVQKIQFCCVFSFMRRHNVSPKRNSIFGCELFFIFNNYG